MVRGAKRKISDEQRVEIVDKYNSGVRFEVLSIEYACSYSTIRNICKYSSNKFRKK